MRVRAKFRVQSITTHEYGARTVKASAVGDNNPENSQFNKATPSGEISFSISKDVPAYDAFEVGKSYYLDFTPADAPTAG